MLPAANRKTRKISLLLLSKQLVHPPTARTRRTSSASLSCPTPALLGAISQKGHLTHTHHSPCLALPTALFFASQVTAAACVRRPLFSLQEALSSSYNHQPPGKRATPSHLVTLSPRFPSPPCHYYQALSAAFIAQINKSTTYHHH